MSPNFVNPAESKNSAPLSMRLNQISRCMRQAENVGQWIESVIDGTTGFCSRAALFAVEGKMLVFKTAKGLNPVTHPVPLLAAPALASAIESQDTVVAVRTAGEMSKLIADAFATADGPTKAHLIPLTGAKRTLAVLYAEEVSDLDALELLMAIAASAREHIHAVAPASQNPLIGIDTITDATPETLRAQRFAHALVSQIRISNQDMVMAGRSNANLYLQLKSEIDAARTSYQEEFCKLKVADHLHLEIVRLLANDDASKLGTEYPGPSA